MHQGFPPHRHRLARFLSVGLLALAWVLLPTLAHATVSVSKQFLPFFAGTVPAGLPVTTASQGDVLTLGIDIQNNNLLLTGGVLTDPLPLGMVLAPLPNPRATAGCAPAGITFVALPGASTFSLSGAQVPPQVGNVPGACSIYVDVTVPLTLATAPNTLTTLNNTIPVTTGFTALDTATNAPINNLMPAQRSITVTSLAALQVTKTFAPATVVMGESTNITLTLTNPNAVPVGVTALGENLPAGLSAQNLTPLFQGACSTATAVASGTTGNVTLTFTNLTLPANGACTLVWPAQVGMFPGLASTTLTNTIAANSMVNSRGLSQAAATRNLTVQAPLNPTKTLTPATAATNQPVVMTINLQNRSATQTLSAVNFSDVFPVAPGAMTLSPGAITATGCGAPTLTPAVALGGETSLQLSGATVAPGATCVITASVQVNTAGAYTNTVNAVSYTSSNPLVGAQTTGAFSAPLTAYSQMLISAKAARDPRVGTNAAAGNVAPGNLLRYQVTLNNYSSAQQALVSFIDPLPASGAAQLTFVPAPAPIFGASCGAPTISPNTLANPALVQFDNIAIAGGTTAAPTACTIDFWVQVPMNWPVGTAINNGSTMDLQQNALSVLQGARPTANSATRAGITTAQTIAPATILQGDLSLLTITLTNNNYVDVLNASLLNAPLFAATAAAEVRLADLPGASTTCGGTPVFTALAGATSLTASGLTIPARGSCTVTVRVRGVVPGTYLNTLPAANVSGSVTVNGVTTTISPVAASTSSLTVTSVLSAAKSFMPTAVSATGGVSRVTVQINNVGTAPLTNVQVTDPLPAGLAVANPANASTTCNGLTILNAVPGSAVAQLQGATVAAGIPCLFQFDAVTTGTAGMTASVNTVPAVTGVVADGGIYNITAASATLTKVAAPAVSVTKSFNPATLMAVGQTSRLQITINNAGLGAIALSNLGLIDNLPLGVVLAATPAVSTTCAGGSVQASPGGSVVALSGGSLPAGASCVFEANITLTSIGTHNNTLPIGIVTNNENITNTAAFTANLQTQSPIGVQKSFAPTSAGVNTPSRLTIQLINARDVTVNSLTVTDTLPLGVVPAVPSAASTTCPGGGVSVTGSVLAGYQVSMSGASLAGVPPGTPGTVCEVSLNVQSPTAGVFINTIPTNGASAIDSVSGLLMANLVPTTATLEVRDTTVLAQAFAAPSVKLGAPNRLTITISNPNSIPLTAVALTDLLPAQVSVALVPNAATTCVGGLVSASAGSSSIRLSGATVPAAVGLVSGSCTVSVDVLSNVPGTYTNTLPAGAVQSNEGVSNLQPVSASFSTFNLPTLGKEFLPVQIAANGAAKLRIVLGNSNPTALTLSANMDDSLPTSPAALALGAPALDTTTLDVLPRCVGAVTLAAPNRVRVPLNTSIPAGGCVVIANVTGAAAGSYNNLIPAGTLQTNAGNNPLPANATLQISARNSISGKVFRDDNNDGVPALTEPGIAAQTIELLDGLTLAPLATTVTDSLGNYAFLDLADGTYAVRQPVQPVLGGVLTLSGRTMPGTLGALAIGTVGTATPVSVTPSVISAIVLVGGQNATGFYFGEILPASLAGAVFADRNNDGVLQASDTPLAGVSIQLTGTDDLGNLINQTVPTAADGSYRFTTLRPGTYALTELSQPLLNGVSTVSGKTVPGTGVTTPGLATPVSVTPSAVTAISVQGNQAGTGFNFAELPAERSLAGRIYTDLAGDGVFNAGDVGLAGLTVTLSGTDLNGLALTRTALSDALGRYSFAPLPEGSYALSYVASGPAVTTSMAAQAWVGTAGGVGGGTASAGAALQTSAISLTGMVTAGSNYDFTRAPASSLSGRVYQDANNNGVFEPAPAGGDVGLPGVTVTLSGTNDLGAAVNQSTTTAADGSYSFTGLRPGTYSVTEQATQPAGTLNGKTTAGSAGGTATALAISPSAINAITLPVGVTATGYEFAELGASSLSGRIYQDANNNGVFEPAPAGGDVGLPGMTVTLTGTDDLGAAVNKPTTTAADGSYSFTGLRPGTYAVTETEPAGLLNGKTTAGSAGGAATSVITVPSAISAIPLTAGSAATGYEFADLGGTSLSGRVYQDKNNNGVFEPAPAGGDVGLPGVTVTLTGTNDLGVLVNQPTTTAADGSYSFTGLRPGTYAVTETEPVGLLNGKTTAGTAGGTATPVTTVPSAISAIALTAGSAATGYEFADLGGTSLSGRVYQDKNNNGVFEPAPAGGDVGLPGMTVTLTGTDDLGGAVNKPTTTAADGSYSFTGLRPGTYAVTETEPVGLLNGKTTAGTAGGTATPVATVPSAISAIALTAGSTATGYEFADLGGTSLSGRLYQDKNNNGVFEPAPAGGDVGLPGVTVTLTGTDDLGAAVNKPTTTAADGSYSFTGLRPGTYSVTETEPVGLLNGKTTAGTAGGTATPVTTVPSAISAIALTAGSAATGYEFADLGSTSLSGRVYQDKNNNGVFEPAPAGGDVGLPGVTVTLTGTNDLGVLVNQPTTTAADGSYSFTGLRPGTYAVTETEPAGLLNGKTTAGTAGGTATPVTTVPSAITAIALTAGSAATGYEFADLGGTSLSGRVYQDKNNNGVFEPAPAGGDVGLPGVTVTLTGTNDLGVLVNQPTTTAADGSYSFTGLRPGTYAVTETEPAGLLNGKTTAGTAGGTATPVTTVPSAITAIALTAGSAATGYEFADLGGTSLSGRVYQDKNNNGVFEPAPAGGDVGLPGVTVTLTGTNDLGVLVNQPTTTAADGSYSFTGLRPGTYAVTETEPAGLLNGKTTAGTAGGTATPVTTVPSAITAIALTAGSAATGYEFADLGGTSLSGRVYQDKNNNGVFEPAPAGGDVGLPGVTVTLTGTNDLGVLVNQPTTTAADGSYSFTGLRPGTYSVTETEPAGLLNGKTTAGTAGGTATPVTTVPSAISAIALTAGSAATGYEFADLGGTSLSGRVYQDKNNNGVFEPAPAGGDVGLPGVTVTLTGMDDLGAAVNKPTTTAADGSYSFTGLRPGTYAVTETEPAGLLNGKTIAGTAGGTATPVTTVPSAITAILLTAGSAATGYEFADLGGTSLSGRVYQDKNNNGVFEPAPAGGDVGLPGVTVTLTGTNDLGVLVNQPTTTAADGSYIFTGLRPGTYSVTETEPVGLLNGKTTAGTAGGTATPVTIVPSAITAIPLTAGSAATGYEFADLGGTSLSGRVYQDKNNNGVFEPAPAGGDVGLPGVTVTLTGTDDLGAAVNKPTTTAADGSYSFTGLRPGTYSVTETEPAGLLNGKTTAGSAGGAATSVITVPSAISGIALTAGSVVTGYEFAELPLTADLAVQKTHQPVRFTVNQTGTYQIRVRNTGSAATVGAVTVQDRLPAGLSLAATPTAVGWMCTGTVGATSFSCSTSDVIAAGALHPGVITARVNVAAAAHTGTPVDNVVLVEGGGEAVPQQPTAQERGAFQSNPSALPLCDGTLPQNACRDATDVQLPASMSGAVWVDTGRTPHVFDSGDQTLKDWIVEVSDPATGAVVATTRTGADGRYVIGDLVPGMVLDVRFRNPQTQVVFGNPVNGETGPGSSGVSCIDLALLSAGQQSSCVDTTGTVSQLKVVLAPGANLVQQSLPIDPSGVTYDTQTRLPVPGTVVTMQPDGVCAGWDPVAGIVNSASGGYTVQGSAISMTTGADGFYQFLFSANAPTLCDFRLSVTPPGTHGFPSVSMPPLPGPLIPPGAPGSTYAVQPSPNPPLTPPGPGTGYYLVVRGGSGGVNIVNNHIPVDPLSSPKLSLSKVADLRSVELGASVRYTVTVRQVAGNALAQATVVDRLPAGFTFIKGTAVLDNLPLADPAGGVGPLLSFQLGALTPGVQRTLQYRVRVGVGALQGDATNRARAVGCGVPAGCTNADGTPLAGSSLSNEGQAKVQVSGGVFASEACVSGKIFVDCNHNHMQDAEELGIPGVRLYMEDGTWLVSDSEGKYSLCGLVPQSHVLKPDPSTLPRGARLTTSSNRNLGDAASLWLDLKNGALQRADFIESSCSNTVLSQVRARRAQGGVRAPETERPQGPPLRFESKAHGLKDALAPQQATETADQRPAIGAPREAEGDRHAR